MRAAFAFVTLLAVSIAAAAELEPPIDSRVFGIFEPTLLQETRRDNDVSWFKIVRNYRWDRSDAWTMGQGFFSICAIRELAIKRGYTHFTRKFRVLEGTELRPVRPNEEPADIAPDAFYILVEWLRSDPAVDEKQLLSQGIIPVANPKFDESCKKMKAKAK